MADAHIKNRGERLRQEREKHGWTQHELAQKTGVSDLSIIRWENSQTHPRQDSLNHLTQAFGKPPEQWGNINPCWSNAPLQNPYFTGRQKLLDNLHQKLATGEQAVALGQTPALSGLGDIGKTQVALEYAYRYGFEYEAVLWVRADTETLDSDFAALASVLELPERQEPNQLLMVEAVKRWLRMHDSWLLVFDNADNLAHITDYLPAQGRGAVLLTTRAQAAGTHIRLLPMKEMSRKDGIEFLLRRIHLEVGQSPSSAKTNPQEQVGAGELWKEVGGLPLALDQAAAYIEETRCTLSDYLALFRTRRKDLLNRRGSPVSEHPDSVAATYVTALRKLERDRHAAAQLLCYCAVLHPDDIPESLFTLGADALLPVLRRTATDTIAWNEVIAELHRYSLVLRKDKDRKILTIHRLVQAVVQDNMNPQALQAWKERAVRVVNAAFPQMKPDLWPLCESLLPHARLAAKYIEECHFVREEAGSLLYKTAFYLKERVHYDEAEQFYQQSLHIREQRLGPDHPHVAATLNALALLYKEQGKYAQAESLCWRALHIWDQHQGDADYPLVAYPLNNLAEAYREQGRYGEAKPLYERALHILEQQGSNHFAFAAVLSNLAIIHLEQQEYDMAETLHRRALGIREQQLGVTHPQTAISLNNLAVLYLLQGRYAEAETLFQKALGIWNQLLDTEHPLLAATLNGMAVLSTEQGKYAQAESLFQQTLHIREQQLGAEHPDTAETLHYFGILEEKRGDLPAASSLYRHALALFEKAFGPQHPKTRDTRQRLATLLRIMGQHAEAAQLEVFQTEPPVSQLDFVHFQLKTGSVEQPIKDGTRDQSNLYL